MLEWLKRHAWKACVRQKRIASSNLALSAKAAPKAAFLRRGGDSIYNPENKIIIFFKN